MLRNKKNRVWFRGVVGIGLAACFLASGFVHAGQSTWTKADGTPVTWPKGKTIKYQIDDESLSNNSSTSVGGGGCSLDKSLEADNSSSGKLSTAQFQNLVQNAFKAWMDAAGGGLVAAFNGTLGVDVNYDNAEKYIFGSGSFVTGDQSQFDLESCLDDDDVNCPDGNNRLILDLHGEIMDAILGPCARFENHGLTAVYPRLDSQGNPTSDIKHAETYINATCLKPVDLSNVPATANLVSCPAYACKEEFDLGHFQGVVTHEVGHFLGLDHSLINKENYLACTKQPQDPSCLLENIVTMVGRPVKGVNLHTLHYDDIATIRKLYSNDAQNNDGYCTIKGTVYFSAGRTNPIPLNENRCVEVVARRDDDESFAVGMVSGNESKRIKNDRSVDDCDKSQAGCGSFTLSGLEPGKKYYLGVHSFAQGNLPGWDIEPCSPVVTDAQIGDAYHSVSVVGNDPNTYITEVCPAGGGEVTGVKVFSN